MARPTPQTKEQLHQRLGEQVDNLLVQDYIELLGSPRRVAWRAIWRSFLVGLAGVMGATLGVALIIYLLSKFGQIPGLGHVAHNISQTIQNYRPGVK